MTDDSSDDIGATGYTIDDLSDYLDRGQQPPIPAIDESPECQAMLASMQRVGTLARELLVHDVRENPTLEESWLSGLLDSISREVRSGRDIPLTAPDPRTRLSVTEGAVRELVRAAGDSIDGVLVGSCSLEGDVETPGSAIRVAVSVSVTLQKSVAELAEAVRQRVYSQLLAHTELTVESIDVTVTDVHVLLTSVDSSDTGDSGTADSSDAADSSGTADSEEDS